MGLLSRTKKEDVDCESVLSNLDRLHALEDARIINHVRPKLDRQAQTAARWLNMPPLVAVPVRYAGQCLGSFCVVDLQARDWTDEDLGILQDLANQAMSELG